MGFGDCVCKAARACPRHPYMESLPRTLIISTRHTMHIDADSAGILPEFRRNGTYTLPTGHVSECDWLIAAGLSASSEGRVAGAILPPQIYN